MEPDGLGPLVTVPIGKPFFVIVIWVLYPVTPGIPLGTKAVTSIAPLLQLSAIPKLPPTVTEVFPVALVALPCGLYNCVPFQYPIVAVHFEYELALGVSKTFAVIDVPLTPKQHSHSGNK